MRIKPFWPGAVSNAGCWQASRPHTGKADSLRSRKGAEELWEVWHIQKAWYLGLRAVQSDPYVPGTLRCSRKRSF